MHAQRVKLSWNCFISHAETGTQVQGCWLLKQNSKIVLLKKRLISMKRVAYSVDPFRFSIVLLKKTDLFGENALWIH